MKLTAKQSLKNLLLVLPLLALAACGSDTDKSTEEEVEKEEIVLTPKEVVTKFVMALADGKCAEAKELSTAVATQLVQGAIDAGCASYRTEIKSVDCTETDEMAYCTCVEMRDGMEMVYKYDLKKVGKQWKVGDYNKDTGMDEEGTNDSDTTGQEGACEDGACEDGACEGGE